MDAREKDAGRWSDMWYLLLIFPELFYLLGFISFVFLTRISCFKTTHANGYYGAWPGWAVSISVLPLTVLPAHRSILTFWGMCEFFSTVATSSSILPSKIQGSSVSTFSHHLLILCTLVIFCCFWSLHWSYLRCEMFLIVVLTCISLVTNHVKYRFMTLV